MCAPSLVQHFEEHFQRRLHYAVFLPAAAAALLPHTFLFSLFYAPIIFSAFFPPCFSSTEKITEMEEGTCQLTGSSFVTVTLCSTYAVDESAAATWRIPRGSAPWLSGGRHLWSAGKSGQLCRFWHAVRHSACTACPALTRCGVAGMLMGAV